MVLHRYRIGPYFVLGVRIVFGFANGYREFMCSQFRRKGPDTVGLTANSRQTTVPSLSLNVMISSYIVDRDWQ